MTPLYNCHGHLVTGTARAHEVLNRLQTSSTSGQQSAWKSVDVGSYPALSRYCYF
ncbi:hypothetical protein BaRGS_00016193, partial [Batillaria attramentaria]